MAQSNLDALISPSSLFSDAVNTLIDRYQEAKCQLVAFKELILESFAGPRTSQGTPRGQPRRKPDASWPWSLRATPPKGGLCTSCHRVSDFLRGSQGASLLIPPQGRLTGYPPPTLRQVGPPLVGPCQSAVSGP